MSTEILREWAQTGAWNDLTTTFEELISRRTQVVLDRAKAQEAKYESGVVDGLLLGLSILQGLRSPNG